MDSEVKIPYATARQFARYASAGAVGTAAHYAVFIALVKLGINVAAASAAGFVAGASINYWLNYRYTFKSEQPHRQAVIRFFTVAAAGLILNTVIVFVLDRTHWHYLLAQATATIIVLVWNFAANRRWTFGRD